MTSQSKMPNDPQSFAERFNENVDYARAHGKGATTGMGRAHPSVNVAQTQSDAQARGPTMTTSTDTSGAGVLGTDDQTAGEAQTSIDSTNAGVDHRRTSYSFTAATLSHPDDRTGPEE
ncbi:uncharacterized protein BDV17DRAFT_249504 [Aspergillus undulatus]|uniref:uncharacterized protein n=1 Tax=Aspergillus undulatus TaxID=1810928 RepID=UPI003CCD297A